MSTPPSPPPQPFPTPPPHPSFSPAPSLSFPPPRRLPTLFERVITKRWSIKCTLADRPGAPLCSTASATASVLTQQTELTHILGVEGEDAVALIAKPPFLQSPLRQNFPPYLRAILVKCSSVYREGLRLWDTSPPVAKPGVNSSALQVPCNEAWELGCGGTK